MNVLIIAAVLCVLALVIWAMALSARWAARDRRRIAIGIIATLLLTAVFGAIVWMAMVIFWQRRARQAMVPAA